MLILIIINYLVRSGKIKFLLVWFKTAKRNLKISGYNLFSLGLIMLFFALSSFTPVEDNEQSTLPIPKGIENQLFYLQRDPDANTVIYKLNMVKGVLDAENPISVFWIRYAEDGKVKQLTTIQRKLAYGVNSRLVNKDKHELEFVSYPSLKLYLMKSQNDDKYHVYTSFDQKNIVLKSIFVKTKKRYVGWPEVVYIELKGYEVENSKEINHKIYI